MNAELNNAPPKPAPKAFASFKYQHGGRGLVLGDLIKNLWFIIAVVVCVAFIAYVRAFPALFSLIVPLLIWAYLANKHPGLIIADRFLIVGSRILYYQNLALVRVNNGAETIVLQALDGSTMRIEGQLFPTNARKPDKISKNKSDKFNKVADKLVSKIKAVSPETLIHE